MRDDGGRGYKNLQICVTSFMDDPKDYFEIIFNLLFKLQSNLSQQPPPNNDHLSMATTILGSHFSCLQHKASSEQRPLVNVGHKFYVPRVVVVHMFDSILKSYLHNTTTKIETKVTITSLLISDDLNRKECLQIFVIVQNHATPKTTISHKTFFH